MKRIIRNSAVALLAVASASLTMTAKENPFLQPFTGVYGIAQFEQIENSDFIPAIKAGIEEQDANIKKIIDCKETPNFDNTILPLENISPILDRVSSVFWHYDSALKTPEFATIADEAIPMLNDAANRLNLNPELFAKIKAVYDNRNDMGLNPVQIRLVEKYYRNLVEQGAALSPEKQAQLKEINDKLSKLFIDFNKNLLNATNEFYVLVDNKEELSGLPESSIAMAAEEAAKRGHEGKWAFTLHAASRLPVLSNADNRELRKKVYEGYTSLASAAPYDNGPVIKEIIKLRGEKAKLMGFDNFAQMMTSRVMAKTPEAAENLLTQVFNLAVKRSHEEVADMQAYVDSNGGGFKIAPYDYYYYADKVKQQKYDLDENELREYFRLENVMEGLFDATERLWNVKLTELPDAPKYMDEVTVYDVTDANTGEHVAVWMCDYFPRETKIQGAWMEQMQSAGLYEDGNYRRPIVYNVGSFTKPTADTPSLLTLDEVETVFHEFGHALQGMLTQAPYRSLAGTNVDRDYVELCSQMNEHWAFTPELLKKYARHYKTGEPMPDELIEKLIASSKFNQGFITTELAGAALLDLAYGQVDEVEDVVAFENDFAKKIGMPAEITYRYRSPYFKHIFGDDGYASGYYTYLWSQVLEADAWELFQQEGVFNPETAASFKKNILESGDTEDAMVLFERFRGHKPEAAALLRLRGFE